MRLPSPGEIFQRKYKLQEVLGRGGFAVVFRATDIDVGRDVAIKILAPGEDGYSTGIVSRFGREARVIAGLQDPHTITMFDFGRSEEGLLFMVFEYVRGIDLSDVVKRRGPMDQGSVIHILEQILQSLREAHAAGILHRDIKPANILVYNYMGDEHRVKLLDFGIAKPVMNAEQDGINITREGAIVGTPRYMSPEQIYGGNLTAASDIYSLGLVAHELLTGSPAIRGSNSKETIRAQLSEVPVRLPGTVIANEELRRIIDTMTAREPADRYESAQAVLRALEFVEADATDKMVVPAMGAHKQFGTDAPTPILFAEAAADATNPSGDAWERPVPGQGAEPTATSHPFDEPRTGLSNTAVVILGLAFGAGLVGALMLFSSLNEDVADSDSELSPPALPVEARAPRNRFEPPPPVVDDEPAETATHGAAVAVVEEVDAGSPSDEAAVEPDAGKPILAPRVTGCGNPAPWRGEKYLFVDVGLSRRFWMAYVPRGYDQTKKHPIVLMLHKRSKSGGDLFHYANFQEIADRENLVVIAPDAADPANEWTDRGDIDFLKRAIGETGEVLCLDEEKVHVIARGRGGALARELSCKMPLSGIAITGFSLEVGDTLCKPENPVPTLLIAGKQDKYFPFEGGQGCLGDAYESVATMEKDWRVANECAGKRKTWHTENGSTCYTWSCGEPFVSCHVQGGRDWSNSPREFIEFPGCVSRPANFRHRDIIWGFLKSGGKPPGK